MKQTVTAFCLPLLTTTLLSFVARTNELVRSKAFQGLLRLLNDASSAIQLLIIPFAAIFGTYLFIRRSSADEQEVRGWNRRITIFIISIVLAVSITTVVKLIISYF